MLDCMYVNTQVFKCSLSSILQLFFSFNIKYSADDTSSDKGPKRNFGKKNKSNESAYEKRPRNSLRIGAGGKKGRAAQKNMSRGSLRKRDRSKDKEMKLQARIERRTVELPE